MYYPTAVPIELTPFGTALYNVATRVLGSKNWEGLIGTAPVPFGYVSALSDRLASRREVSRQAQSLIYGFTTTTP
jgi:hypothetical protein